MRNISFLFIALLVVSCALNNDEKNSSSANILTKKTEIKFPIDENSTFEFYSYQLIGDTLAVLNLVNSSLDFYSFFESKLIHRIDIPTEGPSGIQNMAGFIFHNPDSIFILPQFKLSGGVILNVNGGLVDRISVNPFKAEFNNMVNHLTTPGSPSYVINGKVFFSVLPFYDTEAPGYIHEYYFDLTSKDVVPVEDIKKPDYFGDKKWSNNGFSRIILDKNQWLYSWNEMDSVILYEWKEDKMIEKYIPFDNGFSINSKPLPDNISPEKQMENSTKSFVYGKLMYDEKHKLFHRIRFLPLNINDKVGLESNPYLIRDFEIITSDGDFNIKGTTLFKGGLYDPRVAFVGSGGVYLPAINVNNPDLNENEVRYDFYNIK